MAFHANYHRELGKHGKSLQVDSDKPFPCPFCDVTPFADFGQWKTHKYQNHPDFMWRCRFPGCEFVSKNKEYLNFSKDFNSVIYINFNSDKLTARTFNKSLEGCSFSQAAGM